ncbi:hypothetical protein [Asaia spathodeae]|uniref:DUF945 domain-containing protein n=1 Tax=Asaia spathodeae TaxID=657016 RepID=A0ABX2P3N5_9PROT|nr:hypothetical protein [Asaia spathodeae]
MKRPLLAAGLCLVLVGLGTIGVRHESSAELQRALASFRANLPPDARFEYDHAYPRFLARGAGFENARFIRGGTTLTAHVLTVNNPSGYLTTGLSFSKIHAEGITLSGLVSGRIGELTLNKLLLPPVSREKHDVSDLPPLSQIHFRHGQIRDVALGTPDHCTLNLANAAVDNYGHDDGNSGMVHEAHAVCAEDSLPAQRLGALTKMPTGPLALDIGDLRESGIRYARAVALVEQWLPSAISGEAKPFLALNAQGDLSEVPSKSEARNIGIALLGMRLQYEKLLSRQWKEGDKRLGEGNLHNATIRFSKSYALAPFMPDGIHIETLTQNATTDTKTNVSVISIKGTTPKSFDYETTMELANAVTPDPKHGPTLISMSLTYRDDASNLDDLFGRIAALRGQSIAELKSTFALPLALMAQKAPGLDALPAFMLAPSGHSLTVSFHPPEPIDVTAIKALSAQFSADPTMAQRWLAPPVLTSSMK